MFTDVAHGIFRSSPFFLAIQQAYANDGVPEKAELFFKLHELQTCSWGASKIGRVAQTIKAAELIHSYDPVGSVLAISGTEEVGEVESGSPVVRVSKVAME